MGNSVPTLSTMGGWMTLEASGADARDGHSIPMSLIGLQPLLCEQHRSDWAHTLLQRPLRGLLAPHLNLRCFCCPHSFQNPSESVSQCTPYPVCLLCYLVASLIISARQKKRST